MNLRYEAAHVIDEVTHGRSLTDALSHALPKIKDPRDRALVQAICYGVCRFYTRIDIALSYLLSKPMQSKDSDVHALLLVGLYQLMEMRVPEHAAVSETVNATEKLKKPWSRGFVNAILREYLRRQEEIKKAWMAEDEAEYAHPEWWIDACKEAWPNQWQSILKANNAHPPFSIRVNRQHLPRDVYLERLLAKDIKATVIPETQDGIMLESPMPAEELPGFAAGDVFVQDGAAQLAVDLLLLEPNLNVLDACAAPGGKLTHLLEREPALTSVTAVEKDATRVRSIYDNLARLQLQAECICHDVLDTAGWWNGELFDRILLDAPCSASGVIRRHPDIKLLREPSDILAMAEEQFQLVESLWPLLKPGGLMLYATCSFLPEENVQVIQRFLKSVNDAQEEKIDVDWGVPCVIGRQLLPGMHNMDGFYYARIRKVV
jgi:16S rRNA (cytosine967-C5)-methyltransferase